MQFLDIDFHLVDFGDSGVDFKLLDDLILSLDFVLLFLYDFFEWEDEWVVVLLDVVFFEHARYLLVSFHSINYNGIENYMKGICFYYFIYLGRRKWVVLVGAFGKLGFFYFGGFISRNSFMGILKAPMLIIPTMWKVFYVKSEASLFLGLVTTAVKLEHLAENVSLATALFGT